MVGKHGNGIVMALMTQPKVRDHPRTSPAIATDAKVRYREAMIETCDKDLNTLVKADHRRASKPDLDGTASR